MSLMTLLTLLAVVVLTYVAVPATLFVLQFALRVPWRKYALGRHTMYLTAALGALALTELIGILFWVDTDWISLVIFILIGHQLWRRNYLLHKEQGWDKKKAKVQHGSPRTGSGDPAVADRPDLPLPRQDI